MTELLYMNAFDVITCDAQILECTQLPDGRYDVVLNQTCFYPRGGGQDWDTGMIKNNNGTFNVNEVRLDEHGIVHHYGTFEQGILSNGETVTCSVDRDRRQLNTQLHSAGHIVDMAVQQLKLPWIPGKGAHYPHMSFVEYKGELDAAQKDAIKELLAATVRTIVQAGGSNSIRFMPVEEMHTICSHVPEYIPRNKPARVVVYANTFGIPCGGTHVSKIEDVGPIVITKIKKDGDAIKVSYALERC